MQRVGLLSVCAAMTVTLGAMLAPASCAAAPGLENSELLLAPLPGSALLSTSTTPLLAKELAVLTDQGISPLRAAQAIAVQSQVARSDITGRVEAGMGSAFAGAWFEPAAAELHIGVTSPADRQKVEGIVAQEGLSANVVATPVRSTVAQLLATQERWNRKLANLFARQEVKTGIEPQRNAVSVTLTSAVPSSERAALEHEASAGDVNVSISVVSGTTIGVAPRANKTACKRWVTGKAYCNPSITSGVTIERPSATSGKGEGNSHKTKTLDNFSAATLMNVLVGDFVSGPGIPPETTVTAKPTITSVTISEKATTEQRATFTFSIASICTAGPLAIPTANKAARVALTAGHCIEMVHGTGNKWSAYNKAETASVIGEVQSFVYGGAEGAKDGDYGDISIEAAWQSGKAKEPVFAATAEWKKMNEKEEETSYPIKGERKPEVGNTNCHEGQTSGESCGEIKMLNVTWVGETEGKKKFVEGMVEDTGPKLVSESGDSGGPWLFIEEPSQEAFMEGTFTGDLAECREIKAEAEGKQFFKTRTECANNVFPEAAGNKGFWERTEYKCENGGKIEKGPKFFKTKANCDEGEKAGEGEWEREPNLHVVYDPLKQPIAGAAEGSLENLKLELLTTANEVIPPCG
jgi:hypothetical protein